MSQTVPFKMEILSCGVDGALAVQYFPNDPVHETIITHVIPPSGLADEELIKWLADQSPQPHWAMKQAVKTLDLTSLKQLVGTIVENAQEQMRSAEDLEEVVSTEFNALSADEQKILNVTLIVQQVLADMVGATI